VVEWDADRRPHHASFQVFADGAGSRLVWLTDVLPHALATAVQARTERGIVEIKTVLESAETPTRD
jgi:hypothetical protein